MPSKGGGRSQGRRGELAAARKFGWEVIGESCGWADLRAPNGTRYTCKSAVWNGVFRFRKPKLKKYDRRHQAGGAGVVFDSAGETVMKIQKFSLDAAEAAVSGRWYPETQHYEVPRRRLID